MQPDYGVQSAQPGVLRRRFATLQNCNSGHRQEHGCLMWEEAKPALNPELLESNPGWPDDLRVGLSCPHY